MPVYHVKLGKVTYPIIYLRQEMVILDLHLADLMSMKADSLTHKHRNYDLTEDHRFKLTKEEIHGCEIELGYSLEIVQRDVFAYTCGGAVTRCQRTKKKTNNIELVEQIFTVACGMKKSQARCATNSIASKPEQDPPPETEDSLIQPQEPTPTQNTPITRAAVQMFSSPKFGEIRVVEIDGEPWFVAMDVARILDYHDTFNMTTRLPENEKSKITPSALQGGSVSNGQSEPYTIINQPGLFRAIFESKKPEAEEFKTWVYTDILPKLAKTGTVSILPKEVEDHPMMIQHRKDAEIVRKYVELELEQRRAAEERMELAIKLVRNETLVELLQEREKEKGKQDAEFQRHITGDVKEVKEKVGRVEEKADQIIEFQKKETIAEYIRFLKLKNVTEKEAKQLGRDASQLTRRLGRGDPEQLRIEGTRFRVGVYDIDVLESVFADFIDKRELN